MMRLTKGKRLARVRRNDEEDDKDHKIRSPDIEGGPVLQRKEIRIWDSRTSSYRCCVPGNVGADGDAENSRSADSNLEQGKRRLQ